MRDLNEPDAALVQLIQARYRAAEDEHQQFRRHASEFYALYRGYQDFRQALVGAENDRDVVIRDGQKEWGAELFIPYAFRTIETIVPRMLAHRPAMIPVPLDKEALGTVDNMRLLVQKQQDLCSYQQQLHMICKDGLMYGLGVQKTGWKKEYRKVQEVVPGTLKGWVEKTAERCTYDDAYAEWVDPFTFLWDPAGHSMETCRYVIQRTWRDNEYVRKMVQSRKWRAEDWDNTATWTLEELLEGSAPGGRNELSADLRRAEGYSTDPTHTEPWHEVLEYHDGERVITVLDREFPVQVGANPMPDGSIPYQVFRPTLLGGRMVGIGEIEPIRDLQYEINTLRGQRRDATTMALGAGYFFDESLVDVDDLQMGPNLAIPVNGDPRSAIFPIPVRDVPMAGYNEAREIASDIETTTGIADPVAGGGESSGQTATGAQLVHQAANFRIQAKTKLLGEQVIIPGGEAFVRLNQVKILSPRPVVQPEDGAHTGAWQIKELGPAELRGMMTMTMTDGSTLAENVPQDRNDAQLMMGLMANPIFRPEMTARFILEKMGVKTPESWIVPPEPQIAMSQLQPILEVFGIPPQAFMQVFEQMDQQRQMGEPDPAAGANAPQGVNPADTAPPEDPNAAV